MPVKIVLGHVSKYFLELTEMQLCSRVQTRVNLLPWPLQHYRRGFLIFEASAFDHLRNIPSLASFAFFFGLLGLSSSEHLNLASQESGGAKNSCCETSGLDAPLLAKRKKQSRSALRGHGRSIKYIFGPSLLVSQSLHSQ